MRAVVICEDHTLDEHVVKPVVEAVFRELGRRCSVQLVSNPRVRGVEQALDAKLLQKVFTNYPMGNIFFLIVDRDGDETREEGKLADRKRDAQDAGKTLFTCLALEEVEVWALALHRQTLKRNFHWDFKKQIRPHRDPKEAYFEPFVQKMGWQGGLGKGRKAATKDLRKKWKSLKSACPEIQQLIDDVRNWLQSQD